MPYKVVPDFMISSSSANFYLTYHLALITQAKKKFTVSITDSRFVVTGPVDVHIHYGPTVAIEYKCEPGDCYRMPRIVFAE